MKLIDSTGADLCKFMQIMHQFPDDCSWALLRHLTEHKAPKKNPTAPFDHDRPIYANLCKFYANFVQIMIATACLTERWGLRLLLRLFTPEKKVSSPPEVWLPASGFRTVANHSGFCFFFLFFFVFLCCF